MTLILEEQVREILCSRFNLLEGTSKFSCRMIEPGIISYLNTSAKDVVLLRKETIDRCIASAIGNPLTIGHIEMEEEVVPEGVDNGKVISIRYNAGDGWYYVDGYVDTEQAKTLIRRGHRPSCGFKEKKVAINTTGLRYHGFHYDKEITELEFHHLAIVKKPRFEDAVFRLNSLTVPMKNIFTLLREIVTRKNKADGTPELDGAGKPIEEKSVEKIQLDGDMEVEVTSAEGKMFKGRLNDFGTAWMKQTADAAGGENHEIEIEAYEGMPVCRVDIATLKSTYNKHRKNEADAVKKEAEGKAEKDRLNEAETKRKNEAFEKLRLAGQGGQPLPMDGGYSTTSGSIMEKCERGKLRY